MNSHVQLDEEGKFLRFIPAGLPIEWDANNYCSAFGLESDGKSEDFRVFPFYTTAEPTHEKFTQCVRETDPIFVDGR